MAPAAAAPSVTIVIPAYNEAEGLGRVLADLLPAGLAREVIVVDDGSTDATAAIAEAAGARVLRHAANRGYGSALKTGIRAASTDLVLTMDADGQHRLDHARALCQAAGSLDMAVGQRTRLLHSPLWRMPGKWLLGFLAGRLVRRRIPDLNSGLRLFRRDVVGRYLHLCPEGFSFSTTITLCLLARGYAVAWVPIEVEPRVGRSTVTVRAGLETLVLLLRVACLFNPLRVFIPISLICGLAGVAWGIPYLWWGRGVSVGMLLALVTALLLFVLGLLCDQISSLRLEKYE